MPSVCHQVQNQKYEKIFMKIPAFNEIHTSAPPLEVYSRAATGPGL
jgi:hypothetical protein